ncbi:conserved hypothetical protein [Desulfamplus magnetovallimortis]|uniref:Uncharacterized protein n=1 Tax=Desulfamplus magnetovallimortis TaxID=1246637 RepID=A0A1W1H8H2_9BACT|nr:conserved hypothetical protein [Desulfamplus magnetovallimortis]
MEAKNDGMRNTCESLINVVSDERLKMLLSLNQKVRGMVMMLRFHHT